MFHSVRHGRAAQYPHKWLFETGRIFLACLRTKFAATASILLLSTTSFAVTANAVEANVRNDSFSALRDYVLAIDTSRKSTDSHQRSNNSSGPDSIDAAYATLRAFAAQNGVEQPPSTAGQSKLADADSLIDFLRQGGSSAKPSVAPQKGPAAGGTQPSAPVDATYIGA
ncbi:MAG: hypothetical protein WB721_01300, partial [Pseudolabrys sp.]